MVSGATLGAIAGFLGALVTLGIPLGGFLLRVDRRTRRVLTLVAGPEETDEEGVLPRLQSVEEDVEEIEADVAGVETALAAADKIEYPTEATGS
jgi:hypothetical protein